MRARPAAGGFTLLELLVTAGILALLAGIAWPSWSAVMRKARRIEARIGLLQIQHAQERHFASHLRYAASLQGDGGLAVPLPPPPADYVFSIQTSDDGQYYRALAEVAPDGRQQADLACRLWSVDASGQREARDAAGSPAGGCW